MRHLVLFPSPPSYTSANTAKASGAVATDGDVSPLTTLDDLNIRRMLDYVLTIQATHG